MRKKYIVSFIFVVLAITMACTISYEGVNFGSDPDVEFIEDQTATAASASTPVAQQSALTPEPEYQPIIPQSSTMDNKMAGTHEYSVVATNFDCICQVSGNATSNFGFTDSKLEIKNPDGNGDVYEKIGENTYKRTFMGSYILVEGSGAQATETVVEEEKHVVIILTDTGYVMEHYSGSSSDPCCYHTFTMIE